MLFFHLPVSVRAEKQEFRKQSLPEPSLNPR